MIERATGKVLRRFTAVAREEFTPNKFGESLEGSATDSIATSLAQDVVEGLERPIGSSDAAPLAKPPRSEAAPR